MQHSMVSHLRYPHTIDVIWENKWNFNINWIYFNKKWYKSPTLFLKKILLKQKIENCIKSPNPMQHSMVYHLIYPYTFVGDFGQ